MPSSTRESKRIGYIAKERIEQIFKLFFFGFEFDAMSRSSKLAKDVRSLLEKETKKRGLSVVEKLEVMLNVF